MPLLLWIAVVYVQSGRCVECFLGRDKYAVCRSAHFRFGHKWIDVFCKFHVRRMFAGNAAATFITCVTTAFYYCSGDNIVWHRLLCHSLVRLVFMASTKRYCGQRKGWCKYRLLTRSASFRRRCDNGNIKKVTKHSISSNMLRVLPYHLLLSLFLTQHLFSLCFFLLSHKQ